MNENNVVLLTISPLLKALEAIHHRTIISVCRRCQNDKQQAHVQPSHSLLLVPSNAGKVLPRQLEGRFRVLEVHDDVRRRAVAGRGGEAISKPGQVHVWGPHGII